MRYRWLLGLSVAMAAPFAVPAWAQESVPQIPFESVPNFLKLPADMNFGEAAGVAVNSKGQSSSFRARLEPRPRLWPPRRSCSSSLRTASSCARSARTSMPGRSPTPCAIDKDDNIWAIDKGSDMIIKFNPQGPRDDGVRPQAGSLRRRAPSRWSIPSRRCRRSTACSASPPTSPGIRDGNIYISDGYINSRVAKVRQERPLAEVSGASPGNGPGQFNTPHSDRVRCEGQHLCRRSRQPPHPGVRPRRQVPAPDSRSTCRSPGRRSRRSATSPIRRNCRQTAAPWSPARRGRSASRRAPNQFLYSRRRLSRPHLQADARRQGARRARQLRPAAEAVRLDPRDRVPVGERAVTSPKSSTGACRS